MNKVNCMQKSKKNNRTYKKRGNQTTSGQWTMSKPWPPKITEEPVATTIRPQITMIPRQPSTTDKPSLPLSKSMTKPTVTTFKTPTTQMPSQPSTTDKPSLPLSKSTTKPTVTTFKTSTTQMPSQPLTTDKSSLPPCIDTAEITDYSDHDLDIGKIVIRNQEQQIPGVTCQELPPCPDLSDFSDDGVDIGELSGRTPKNLIPGVTCKVIQVMPVPFLIPVQEEPEVTTTQKPQTNGNSEISVTNDTQIPIRGNPQISIIEKSEIVDTEEKPVPFLIPISEQPQVATTQEPPKSKTPKVSIIEDTQIPIAENPQILITEKSQTSDTETSQTFKTMPIQPTTVIQAPPMVLTPKVKINTELPPCIETFDSPDYSDYNLDIGTIVITNLEQQIPGVTCQNLPPCPDISDYSDGIGIGELGGRNPENLIPGVTCNINKVTTVSFLVPIQEKPQVITTEKTQTSKNPQISTTEDTQIPITENPQISITDISQIADTKLPQISNPIPTQPKRVILAPKPTTKPSVSTFKIPTTMMPSQTSTTIKLNADEESQIFSDNAVPFLDYDYDYEYDGIVVAEYLDIISTGDSFIDISY